MSDERDFEIEAGDLQSDADPPAELSPGPAPASAPPPPPPKVVIQYRSQGLHTALLPPLLILLAALAITSYQRQTRLRPLAPPPTVTKPAATATPEGPGRLIMVDSSATGAAVDPITVRAALPPPPAPIFAPAPGAVPRPTPPPTPETDAVAEAENALAHADTPAEPGPFSPLGREIGGDPEPIPSEAGPGPEIADAPPLIAPAPLTSAHGEAPSADSPELAFRVVDPLAPAPAPEPGPGPGPALEPEPEPRLTKEQILQGIQDEAALKKADQKNLEREAALAREREHQELIRKSHDDRIAFHGELRMLLRKLGDGAGKEINALCSRYGRDMPPAAQELVRVALKRWAARNNLKAKIDLMRRFGVPEPVILDNIANGLDKTINTRGGPRDRNEVLARAALRLLAYPPPAALPTARPTSASPTRAPAPTRSVAEVSAPPVPRPARPPQ